jgi:S-(hydroxymethyl)glutathione dehydrogenase/alcohol dehydrogenase
VTSVAVGDHVIPLYTPECRQCKSCLSRKTNLCTAIRGTQGKGVMPDGTSRFRLGSETIYHYMGCSTFSNFTVMPEIAVAKVREDAPFDKICYYWLRRHHGRRRGDLDGGGGAGIERGRVRARRHRPQRHPGARLVGADRIIGVDINPGKARHGRGVRMTDFINPKEIGSDKVVAAILDLTDGGADYSFDCTGNTEVMRQALECCHRGWGESVIIGVAESGKEISTRPFQLVTGRVWKGTAFGGRAGGPTCRGSSTGIWTARSTSTISSLTRCRSTGSTTHST